MLERVGDLGSVGGGVHHHQRRRLVGDVWVLYQGPQRVGGSLRVADEVQGNVAEVGADLGDHFCCLVRVDLGVDEAARVDEVALGTGDGALDRFALLVELAAVEEAHDAGEEDDRSAGLGAVLAARRRPVVGEREEGGVVRGEVLFDDGVDAGLVVGGLGGATDDVEREQPHHAIAEVEANGRVGDHGRGGLVADAGRDLRLGGARIGVDERVAQCGGGRAAHVVDGGDGGGLGERDVATQAEPSRGRLAPKGVRLAVGPVHGVAAAGEHLVGGVLELTDAALHRAGRCVDAALRQNRSRVLARVVRRVLDRRCIAAQDQDQRVRPRTDSDSHMYGIVRQMGARKPCRSHHCRGPQPSVR